MRRQLIHGVAATALALTLTYQAAAAVISPLATPFGRGTLITWGRAADSTATYYKVWRCAPYDDNRDKCEFIGAASYRSDATEFSIYAEGQRNSRIIVAGFVTTPNQEEQEVDTGEVAFNAPRTYPLNPGCQINVATGEPPFDAVKAAIDAGGVVTMERSGSVYQTTFKRVGLQEDDEGFADMRDFEVECMVYVP